MFLQAGQDTAAAFLESQRVAAIKGATSEFEKLEGFTFGKLIPLECGQKQNSPGLCRLENCQWSAADKVQLGCSPRAFGEGQRYRSIAPRCTICQPRTQNYSQNSTRVPCFCVVPQRQRPLSANLSLICFCIHCCRPC